MHQLPAALFADMTNRDAVLSAVQHAWARHVKADVIDKALNNEFNESIIARPAQVGTKRRRAGESREDSDSA